MRPESSFPLLALLAALTLTGCSANFGPGDGTPVANPIGALRGNVHGGQQPISGAHVYLYAAATTGYGTVFDFSHSPTTTPSVSLLNALSTGNYPTTVDSNGNYYVTTDANGGFSLTGAYTCTAGTQVYIYVNGGNPGLAATASQPTPSNSAIGLMAALGQCPNGGSLASYYPYVVVNEVTTVAAAYAIAGFANDATHIGSSGTTQAQIGIGTAFANAANLADLPTGTALAQTPSGYPGTVPQALINTIANSLAACVNSTGSTSSACTTLLGAATGGLFQRKPTETASAAINIAQLPALNAATILSVAGSDPPFLPIPKTPPTDLTLTLQFTSGIVNAAGLAVDSSGDIWIVEYASQGPPATGNALMAYSGLGVPLFGAPYTSGLTKPLNVAIDPSDNIWVTNGFSGVAKFNNAGVAATGSPFATDSSALQLSIDGSGSVYVAGFPQIPPQNYAPSIVKYNNDGSISANSPFTGGGLLFPTDVAVWNAQGTQYIFVPDYDSSQNAAYSLSLFASAGGTNANGYHPYTSSQASPFAVAAGTYDIYFASSSAVTDFGGRTPEPLPAGGPTSVQLSLLKVLALDGFEELWYATGSSSIAHLPGAFGTNNSPIISYTLQLPAGTTSNSVAVDPSGNVWITSGSSLLEVVGAANPVVTPIALSVKNNTMAQRP